MTNEERFEEWFRSEYEPNDFTEAEVHIQKKAFLAACPQWQDVTIVKVDSFRSAPLVNADDDMVRVVLDMPKREWGRLKSSLPLPPQEKV